MVSSKNPEPVDQTRPGTTRTFVRKIHFLVIFLILLCPLTFTFGDDNAVLTVVNLTGHYLHIIISGDPHLYIPPRASVTAESEGPTSFVVDAFYAPAQGVKGNVTRTIEVAPYRASTTGCDYSSSGGCECSTNPATGGAILWEITPDSLTESQ
jgi:hypothetical protein